MTMEAWCCFGTFLLCFPEKHLEIRHTLSGYKVRVTSNKSIFRNIFHKVSLCVVKDSWPLDPTRRQRSQNLFVCRRHVFLMCVSNTTPPIALKCTSVFLFERLTSLSSRLPLYFLPLLPPRCLACVFALMLRLCMHFRNSYITVL